MVQRLVPLAFRLPEFTRDTWVSDNAKYTWTDRLRRISKAWQTIESESVRQGVRRAAIVATDEKNLQCRLEELTRLGYEAEIIDKTRLQKQYSGSIARPSPGEPASLRLIIGDKQTLACLSEAYRRRDVITVGAELGYPPCCCEFFYRTWMEEKLRDTTWSMASATNVKRVVHDRFIEVDGSPVTNMLWRWKGVRAVPHLPCRFDCQATIVLAGAMLEVGRRLGFESEISDLLAILSWPVDWSALHGIAEIKNPILKLITSTDASAEVFRVRRLGSEYPNEGAYGLNFPYRTKMESIHLSKVYDICNEKSEARTTESSARDNGFLSINAMNAAHEELARVAGAMLGENERIVDFGCGNGALLQRIVRTKSSARPYGIDRRSAVIESARRLMPDFTTNFVVGDIWAESQIWSQTYQVGLISVWRLVEAEAKGLQRYYERLLAAADIVLVYQYRESGNGSGISERMARLGMEVTDGGDDGKSVTWGRLRLKE